MPLGSAVVVMNKVSTAMVIVCVAVCAGVEESVRFTVNVNEPAEVGVPLRRPFVLSVNPGGRVPLVTVAV